MNKYVMVVLLLVVCGVNLYQNIGSITITKESCSKFFSQIVQEKVTFYGYESPFIIKEYLTLQHSGVLLGDILPVPIGWGEMNIGCTPFVAPPPILIL